MPLPYAERIHASQALSLLGPSCRGACKRLNGKSGSCFLGRKGRVSLEKQPATLVR